MFKGRGQTFVQKHWDERVTAWLKKLAGRFRWLGKVGRFEVRVDWGAVDGAVRSKGGKRTVGGIVGAMVRTVTGFGEGSAGRRKTEGLKVSLRVEDWIAVECAGLGLGLGLREFFVDEEGWLSQRREVWIESRKGKSEEVGCGRLVPVPSVKKEERSLFVAEGKSVDWASWGEARLVMKRRVEWENTVEVTLGDKSVEGDAGADFVLRALVEECVGGA